MFNYKHLVQLSLVLSILSSSVAIAMNHKVNIQQEGDDREIIPSHVIFNGESAVLGEFPTFVGIFRKESIGSVSKSTFKCGASLIAPSWVITALHCVASGNQINPPGALVLGLWRFDSLNQIKALQFDNIYAYNFKMVYSLYPGNDLALIHLKYPIIDTKPTLINTKRLTPGVSVKIIGFGRTSFALDSTANQLQKADTLVVNNSVCKRSQDPSIFTAATEICTQGQTKPSDPIAYHGDSGSPLFVYDNSNGIWKQDGVTSRGDELNWGEESKLLGYGIYSEISSPSFKKWIQDTTKEQIRYGCKTQRGEDAHGIKGYILKSCGAGGYWSKVAPYIGDYDAQNTCIYSFNNQGWQCNGKANNPVAHYKDYFSGSFRQNPDGSFSTTAKVPLTELGL